MRTALYLLILAGIVYGAITVFGGDSEPAPLSANGGAGESAAPGPASPADSTASGEQAAAPATAAAERSAPAVSELVEKAEAALERSGNAATRVQAQQELDTARRFLSDAYLDLAMEGKGDDLRARLDELNDLLLGSEEVLPGKSALYTIRANDRLWTL